MYGKLGVLETDGERVQCHVCGKWYRNLHTHVWFKHSMSADEYREEYNLNKRQPLCSTELSQILREIGGTRLKAWAKKHPDECKKYLRYGRSLSLNLRPKKMSLQARINMRARSIAVFQRPDVRAKAIATLQRSDVRAKVSSRNKQAFKSGTSPLQRPEVIAKRIAAMKRPEVRAKLGAAAKRPEVRAKMSEAAKKRASDPAWRESAIERLQTPEAKAAHAASMRRPEVRAKMAASARKRKETKCLTRASTLTCQGLRPFQAGDAGHYELIK